MPNTHFELLFGFIIECASSLLFSANPVPIVVVTISEGKYSLTVSFAIDELARVLGAVCPLEIAFTVHRTVIPLSLVK